MWGYRNCLCLHSFCLSQIKTIEQPNNHFSVPDSPLKTLKTQKIKTPDYQNDHRKFAQGRTGILRDWTNSVCTYRARQFIGQNIKLVYHLLWQSFYKLLINFNDKTTSCQMLVHIWGLEVWEVSREVRRKFKDFNAGMQTHISRKMFNEMEITKFGLSTMQNQVLSKKFGDSYMILC